MMFNEFEIPVPPNCEALKVALEVPEVFVN
jgi:hypothetical protein